MYAHEVRNKHLLIYLYIDINILDNASYTKLLNYIMNEENLIHLSCMDMISRLDQTKVNQFLLNSVPKFSLTLQIP